MTKPAVIKRVIVTIIGLVIIAAAIGGFYFWYLQASFDNLVVSANLIGDGLSEAVVAKDAGDMIVAKKKNLPAEYTWKNLYDRTATVAGLLGGLVAPGRLEDYKKICTIWTVKVREAAKDGKTWSEVPAGPGDFVISLRDKEAQELVKNSLMKLAEIRQFGDLAVANKDREALRRISAKLLVQKHWLDGITHYQPAGILASLATPAYAYQVEGKKVCFTTWNGKPLCSLEVQEINTEMYNAANDVIAEKKDAETAWYKASQEVFAKLEAEGMPIETLGGVANTEDKTANREPVLLTNFKTACLERGGIIGGANQISDRIPTSERGTYCGYKNQANNCWNYMTNSGGYYSGGDVGCPRAGVTPAELGFYLIGTAQSEPEPAAPAPVKTPAPSKAPAVPTVPKGTEPPPINEPVNVINIPDTKPIEPAPAEDRYPYDGYYYVSETYNCVGDDGRSFSINDNFSITVTSGIAKNSWSPHTAVLSGNAARFSGTFSDSGYNITYTLNANFSISGNGLWVSGTRNWTQTSANISGGRCNGSFQGKGN